MLHVLRSCPAGWEEKWTSFVLTPRWACYSLMPTTASGRPVLRFDGPSGLSHHGPDGFGGAARDGG